VLIDGDKSRKTFKRPLWRGGFHGLSCGSVVLPRSLGRNLREAILNMRTSRPNLRGPISNLRRHQPNHCGPISDPWSLQPNLREAIFNQWRHQPDFIHVFM